MTRNKVVAIGLDSADPLILEEWIEQGYLSNLSGLMADSAYVRLNNWVNHGDHRIETKITERVWAMFLSGCLPNTTGYWGPIQYQSDSYQITHDYLTGAGAYDFQEHPLFYALGEAYKVGTFDVPGAALSNQVNGIQVLGWGGHAPCTASISQPDSLLSDIIKKYGKNPILNSDHGFWWDVNYVEWIQKVLKNSSKKRAEICIDLLQQGDWDFFMTAFAESHTAGHDFWHLSQPQSPFYSYKQNQAAGNPMLQTFTQIDQAVGQIVDSLPPETYKVIFSLHGMGNNITDLSSMMFLPELLYRFNFPGKYGFAATGKSATGVPEPIVNPRRRSWPGEIWQSRQDPNLGSRIKQFIQLILAEPWQCNSIEAKLYQRQFGYLL